MLTLVGIDRDGTINYDDGFFGKDPLWERKLQIYPLVFEGIKLLNKYPEIKIAVATNQPGVAREYFDCQHVEQVNKRINEILVKNDCRIDRWQYCPYVNHDYMRRKNIDLENEFILENDDRRNELRKPGIGMLKMAAKELGHELEDFNNIFFIGNELKDLECGLNANGTGVLITDPMGLKEHDIEKMNLLREKYGSRVYFSENFLDASRYVVSQIGL